MQVSLNRTISFKLYNRSRIDFAVALAPGPLTNVIFHVRPSSPGKGSSASPYTIRRKLMEELLQSGSMASYDWIGYLEEH